MSWAEFYLICFIVGFALSLISLLSGLFDLHLPHHGDGHIHVGHAGHVGHVGHGGHVHAHVHAGDLHGNAGTAVSPFNFPTITAFLAWFGGVGYLLTRFSGLWMWLAFFIAVVGGVLGASAVFLFLVKVLLAHDRPLDPSDYEMVGVLGQLTSAIREGGTGEMSFSQAGHRRSAIARSEDGTAIPRGVDVLVTRYDKGIAYVRLWEDLNDSKETL